MTYMGYQVRHLPDQTEKLNEWLEKRPNISVWGCKAGRDGCNYGTNPEETPWGDDAIKAFEDFGSRCEFSTEKERFVLKVTELPADKWGNTATYADGLTLEDGCLEVAYNDDTYTEYHLELDMLDDRKGEFLSWLEDNRPEIISTVGESGTCNNFGWSWNYWTTNKPLDSQEWKDAIADFLNK